MRRAGKWVTPLPSTGLIFTGDDRVVCECWIAGQMVAKRSS
jgi:hypothetical protein